MKKEIEIKFYARLLRRALAEGTSSTSLVEVVGSDILIYPNNECNAIITPAKYFAFAEVHSLHSYISYDERKHMPYIRMFK